ncbi:AAA family ATPase [Streptomyces sp. NPDC101151]|uniref:helix-turn-helix transcriptional regulator n=1 Tax=Streptomyces sp. NPDC101151 TaxID=3366115 RepID=UPI0037F7BEF7
MTQDAGPGPLKEFVGRERELNILQDCLEAGRRGIPWLITVQGRAGIGKTALIRQALSTHPQAMVWWAGCDLVEQDWPLGTVDQLLRRVDRAARAEFPALDALAPSSSAAEVGAQLLQLLGHLEQRAPVVVVIDDAHWADQTSVKVISFVARRLSSDRVTVILAARTDLPTDPVPSAAPGMETTTSWSRLSAGVEHARTVAVDGLGVKDVARLAALKGRVLSPTAAGRLQRHTDGHPLYVQAIVADAQATEGLKDPARPLPVPPSLSATVLRHVARLTDDSRALTEALAVLDARVPLGAAAQVAAVQDAEQALDSLLESNLVQWWPADPTTPVQLRHTLLRETVYQALSPVRRRTLHAAAATVVDHSAAWAHRVAAGSRGDRALIRDLRTEAGRQAEAGRLERAATLLLWAADLCEERAERENNLLTAATHLVAGNNFGRAVKLRTTVEHCAPSPLRSALLGQLAQHRPGGLAAAERHLNDATEAAAAHGDTWVQTLADMWLGSLYTSQGNGEAALAPIRRALRLGFPYRHMTHNAQSLLVTATLMNSGPQAGLHQLQSLAALPAEPARVPAAATALLRPRGTCQVMAGALHAARDDLSTLIARIRAGHSPTVYPADHYMLAICHYLLGDWDSAVLAADYALTLTELEDLPYGMAPARAVAAAVAAGRGRWQEATFHCRAEPPQGWRQVDRLYPLLAQAAVAQAHADADAMYAALRRLHDTAPGFLHAWQLWWLPLETEALIGTERLDEAQQSLKRLDAFTSSSPATAACLHSATARLKGRLAEARRDPHTAQELYAKALDAPAPHDDLPLHRAMLHQAYGQLLLATADRRTAADQLRRAHRAFTALEAAPFLERVTTDLAACGLRPPAGRSGSPADLTRLTEREHAVAHLAAQGHTNQEIANKLYVSIKTVEYHLGHVYTKLGLTSRRQLHTALGQTPTGPFPPAQ